MALKGFLLAWTALGSAAHLRDLEIFEIDPATQAFEIQRIKDSGISLPPSVIYFCRPAKVQSRALVLREANSFSHSLIKSNLPRADRGR